MRAALASASDWGFRARLHRPVTRAVYFGTVWGLGLGLWLVGLAAWHDGGVCLPEAGITIALSIAGGIPTIGLFAALTPYRPLETARPRASSGAADPARPL
jgi:hypothetical protein